MKQNAHLSYCTKSDCYINCVINCAVTFSTGTGGALAGKEHWMIIKCINIFTKMLKDVGMEAPKI